MNSREYSSKSTYLSSLVRAIVLRSCAFGDSRDVERIPKVSIIKTKKATIISAVNTVAHDGLAAFLGGTLPLFPLAAIIS